MHNLDDNSHASSLQLALALLHDPARALALGQFIGAGESAVRESLEKLRADGLVSEGGAGEAWRVAGEAARRKLGQSAARQIGPNAADMLQKGLALLWEGQPLEGTRRLIHVLRDLIYAGHTPGALACLDILLYALEKWGRSPNRPEAENDRYLYHSKLALGVVLYLGKRRRRAKALFATLAGLAESCGDRRSILRLSLMQVCLHYILGDVLSEDPEAAMDRIRDEARALGDADILMSASHGIGMQHYINGEFGEVIENYRHFQRGLNDDDRFYTGIATYIVAFSACNLGLFGNAIGAVLRVLRIYMDRGAQYAVKSAQILGCDVLLRAGRTEEARQLIDERTDCDLESESRLALWQNRNLAFYHLQKRDNVKAHSLLTECAGIARRYNIHLRSLWLPDVFEMLWAFHEAGLPEIPGHSLEDELDRAITGANVHDQGVALCIRAKQLIKSGHFQASLPLLEASLDRLERCRAPLGQARSNIVMAESLAGLGREEEARRLRLAACAVLDEHHQYDRLWHCTADELPRLRKTRADGLHRAKQCREALADASDCPAHMTHLQWAIDKLRDELQVERVAVFSVEHDYQLDCLAARDFTPEEQNVKLPGLYGKRMLDCLREGRVLRWRSRYGAVLCLPLRVSPRQNCIFFAHCTYLTESIMAPDNGFFGPVIEFMEDEVRTDRLVDQSVQAAQLREETRSRLAAERIGGGSRLYYGPAVQEILELADKAAPTTAPVLILGETGAGKEELARRLHRNSGRSGPFVVVHPASIPEQLFESELFGHEKGSFTGAYQQKVGLLELADKGTLFIDEIGEISLKMQVKLLRVLQDGKFSRVGGTSLLSSDFRLISATHQDLAEKIRDGSFREDFYYRIAVMPLLMPPLRERPEDVRQLARMFFAHFTGKYKKTLPGLTRDELDWLCSRPWPGNIRELRSYVERGVILYDPTKGGFLQEALERQPVPASADSGRPEGMAEQGERAGGEFFCDDLPPLEELQRRYIEHVLRLTRGQVGEAREILGMKLSTLYKKMKKYGLDKTTLIYGPRR